MKDESFHKFQKNEIHQDNLHIVEEIKKFNEFNAIDHNKSNEILNSVNNNIVDYYKEEVKENILMEQIDQITSDSDSDDPMEKDIFYDLYKLNYKFVNRNDIRQFVKRH